MRNQQLSTRRVFGWVVVAAFGVAIGIGADRLVLAQQSGIKRTILLKVDNPAAKTYDVVMGSAELALGGAAGKHYHHGLEIGYALEGSAVLEIQGKPPITLTPGTTYQIDPATPHDVKQQGSAPAKVLAIYVIEKDKPLAEPVQ